jgi:diguanylate cyclase (GGDEF)-like protein/PAS domain S-box-containing protein
LNQIWVVFATILTINAIAAIGIFFLLSRKHPAPGLKDMSRMFLGLAVWAFFYGLTAITAEPGLKHFWLKVENIGIASVPVFWFLFVARFTRQDKWLSRPIALLFWIIPLVSWICLFSDRWFHFYYISTIPFDGAYGPLVITRGPWYMVQLVQTYSLLASGTIMLTWRLIQYRNNYRKQMVTILGALAIPWLVNALYQAGPNWLPPIDLTPISFTLSALFISVSVFGMQLFDLVPFARHLVMEQIPELVLVVDANNRVVDANQVALRWLQKSDGEVIGNYIFEVLSPWPQLADQYNHVSERKEEIQIAGDMPRTLEIIISPLYSPYKILEGHIIVAHDITERRNMENKVKQANQSLQEQLAQIEVLQEQLREQAIRDSLTGLYNRRYLADFLDKEIARASRKGYPISFIVMDIDHFKRFNDTYGHKCGDVVLQELGNMLMLNVRRGDTVCRYGGEEFVILLPDTSLKVATMRAEEWRRAFDDTVLEYEGKRLHVTISVGVAAYPLHGQDGESALQAADHALYHSKHNGRNCVTVYEPH